MYIILVYDVGEERVGKVCKYLRRYLPRVQNSVFEGELPESKLEAMKAGLRKLLHPDHDSALLWVLRDPKWAERQIIGTEKLPVSNFL
ncbi:MAG: CRISPR-associated endonuclease Cas2 [Armatimonadota bacterium]|nr:CRISPR-associated endonuclease Cas2 [Armatimonadota bacterium]